jgi:hypothetical protein
MVQRTNTVSNTQITHQTKQMTLLLYFTAIALSVVSAYYSIAGLTAIFAAAVIPIMIMGGVLEFAKLVVASWLYRTWKYVPIIMRAYFTCALVILMSLTSMGIFGYLSKAHLDQAVPTGDVASKIEIIDQKLKTEKDNVESARNAIKQLDAQVDQAIGRSDNTQGVERSVQIRRGQQKERSALLADIGSAQARIARLNEERAPIAAELRKVEAEVGPIKYIAALLYGDNPDQGILEKAVRIVIIMIVIVFDPLAVLLLMAANTQIKQEEEPNGNTEETIAEIDRNVGEKPTEEELSEEDNSEEEASTINRIKERFINKFRAAKEPDLGQQTTESSAPVWEPATFGESSPGVTIETKELDSNETKKSDWIIGSDKREMIPLDQDGAGRITTALPPDFIVDWSNKEKPVAVPRKK